MPLLKLCEIGGWNLSKLTVQVDKNLYYVIGNGIGENEDLKDV